MIYNTFFIPGKVPSLNELENARGMQSPQTSSLIRMKGQSKNPFKRFNQYNKVKQLWSGAVVQVCHDTQWTPVEAAHFSYLVCEKNKKRDPSNICSSAIKFIEDGFKKAGVIPGDGWKQVLGISPYWEVTNYGYGVFVVMADYPMTKESMLESLDIHMKGKD